MKRTIYQPLTTKITMFTKPEIRVVQYHWEGANRSYQINRNINKAYCRRHGHEHIVKTFMPREDRAYRWSKIPAMREELHDCDFLLYLDADAFFYSHELRIEDELLPLIEDKQIMMSVNCGCEGLRHQPDRPNAGVVLVRNSERAAEILRVWDESSERPETEYLRFNSPHEQEACYRTICQEYPKDIELLEEYYLMNGLRGMFIRHLMGMEDKDRLTIQQQFLENRKDIILV